MSEDVQPSSTAVPSSADQVLNSVSLADFVATTTEVPRPASLTLDVARHHAFTGEITFSVEPEVRVYLDGGVVYHAERADEPSIGLALVNGGVITPEQLERGMVRVGDVEHLGRLFERDASIDRDAVIVVLERHTNVIVSDLALGEVATASINPYRHHPSGVHRWFVAPVESAGLHSRPLSAVSQVDRSVVDEIPDLGRAFDVIRIEWIEPDPAGLGLPLDVHEIPPGPSDFDLQDELDRFDADNADWTMAPSAAFTAPTDSASPSALGDFQIVWPDGTAGDPLLVDQSPPSPSVAETPAPVSASVPASMPTVSAHVAASEPHAEVVVGESIDSADGDARVEAAPPVTRPVVTAPEPSSPGPGGHGLEHFDSTAPAPLPPPLVVKQFPAPDAVVPDDVAAAVRRALDAIDEASARRTRPRTGLPVTLPRLDMPSFSTPVVAPAGQSEAARGADQRPLPPPVPAAPVGFAPPTLEMSAAAIYARQAALEDAHDIDDVAMVPEAVTRATGKASVVFLDEQPVAATSERRGALRRLIKGLRRGD